MRKLRDITGERFGKLTVLNAVRVPIGDGKFRTKWNCICDCGKQKVVDGSSLTSGKTKTCNGCLQVDISIGQQFGKLTVIKSVKIHEKNSYRTMWECRCECGNIRLVRGTILQKRGSHSCGKCMKSQNLTGRRFERLLVLENAKEDGYWKCVCDCGTTSTVHYTSLLRGTTKSCGCFAIDLLKERNKASGTHHMTNTRLHNIWDTMKARCHRQNSKDYKNYGARGITVCEEWRNKFENFYQWAIDNGYEEYLTLDRKDVNGNYEPTNCRWATTKEQGNNTRYNRYITINGETNTIAEWSQITGIGPKALRYRIESGWDEKDLLLPVGVHKVYITVGNETKTIKEWSREKGISDTVISKRYKSGIRGEDLFAYNRKIILVEIDGVTKSLSDWSKETGIRLTTLLQRYNKGKRGKDLIAQTKKQTIEQLAWDL
jgi:hypothetical protein